jgi:alkylated DNA repair dioxygenase AlkB
VDLRGLLDDDTGAEEAYLLVIEKGVDGLLGEGASKKILSELQSLPWDKKAKMRGRVVNKRARYNLCFAEEGHEADYESGKGTVIAFDEVKEIGRLRERIVDWLGDDVKGLNVEGNYYYDIGKCFIGAHGDAERKKVIGVRFGADFPLYFQWYRQSKRVGKRLKVNLQQGDVYIMSEKATGYDWKKRKILTLRHAAGIDASKLFKK